MILLPSKPNNKEIFHPCIQHFIKYLLYIYLLSIRELEENLMDKFLALVKITVFSIGKKTNSFLLTAIFSNICSLLQPNEAQWNTGPRIHPTCLHICVFYCTIYSFRTETSPSSSARPPLPLSPSCSHLLPASPKFGESCLPVLS